MSKVIAHIISDVNDAISFKWIAESFKKSEYKLHFVLINSTDNSILEKQLRQLGVSVKRINYKSKLAFPFIILKLILFYKKNKIQIVHTHLFEATFLGMVSAKLAAIKKRIYTRHYSTLNHEYYPSAVKWDLLNNKLATNIIAISEIVKEVLIETEKVNATKVKLVYHGFDLSYFETTHQKQLSELREKYKLSANTLVIGVISRCIELKGIQYIIPAFKKLSITYPNAKLVLVNFYGDYKTTIEELLKELPQSSYVTIEHETNIHLLYKLFDVFIHVPINSKIEAFGQTYIESLICKVPLIATKSGIANEILSNEFNAMIVEYKNADEIYSALISILTSNNLKERLIENGYQTVKNKFGLENMISKLKELYN